MSSENERVVEFIANPTQKGFIESTAEADCFSCRKGEGKSAGLVWACFYHTKHNPGATWLFIRDTWENLRRTTLQEFFYWFPPGQFGTWKAGDKEYVWDEQKTGLKGKVIFMGVEDDTDATKIASMPLAGVAIDEPSAAAGEGNQGISEYVFDTAFAQLRQPGMNWYAAKIAQNNPDESHWTYRRFVDPGTPITETTKLLPQQTEGFRHWQPQEMENIQNLPPGYYDRMIRMWDHRPDLLRRFVEGKFGYQQVGKAVTPEFSEGLHLVPSLDPIKGMPLYLLWDGGLNATCVITQVSPLGDWLILESYVMDDGGVFELIEDIVKTRLTTRFRGYDIVHIGDPALAIREQSSKKNSAKKVITRELGGTFIKGPVKEEARIQPLKAVLRRQREGRGIVLIDKQKAKEVYFALRGGWHYHIARGGTIGGIRKDMHSHPGDAMGYGAAVLFPLGKLKQRNPSHRAAKPVTYWDTGTSLGMARPYARLPKEGRVIGGKK